MQSSGNPPPAIRTTWSPAGCGGSPAPQLPGGGERDRGVTGNRVGLVRQGERGLRQWTRLAAVPWLFRLGRGGAGGRRAAVGQKGRCFPRRTR
ncbi:protein of unknown function [Candidatus Hydrogenisulfobacillus filiaventi]|uniref:Uncharacterized protein n=1 Tax=Candidatus Hydrogenisulfobacillus filiaventi TaxID=2707344 RepID=A0A6F8ZE53_9FIRM|nr:protein of unknown function [Candidatus Hydrogenisulfobacillus filiaventi]